MTSRRRNISLLLLMIALMSTLACHVVNDVMIHFESSKASQSIGAINKGRLIHGKRLPSGGPNFSVYSDLGALLGRVSMHGKIRKVVLLSFDTLAKSGDKTHYIVGESGWQKGGKFWPHRTHQNGLSVDFMVPVLKQNQPARLPTWPWQKFGYGVTFDRAGKSDDLDIDFEAIGRHLCALVRASKTNKVVIKRVIFAPDLQPKLYKTRSASCLKRHIRFMKKKAWVRHDDHYHVDFKIL